MSLLRALARLFHRVRSPLVVVTLLVVLGASVDAFARAGGGEHYTPGGGSRSSGNYGGNYGNGPSGGEMYFIIELLTWVIRLTVAYPQFMIPLFVVIAIGVIWMRNQTAGVATQRGLDRYERARTAPTPRALDEARRVLQGRDPDFDPQAFLERTRQIFLDVQEAWFRRDLTPARHLMSDGLHRRFATLLGLSRMEGRRDALADVRLLGAGILSIGGTESFDVISVRLYASLRDTEVDAALSDEQARAKATRAAEQRFTEVWTFVRRPGAKTREGYDLVQGRCPNCGAPFSGGATNKCEYCDAIVNSGRYDWVLSEITQESEYLPHAKSPPGLRPLLARDQDCAAEVLEDRALMLFWKWLEGRAKGDVAPMRKVSTGAFVQEQAQAIERHGAARLKLPAVGGAHVIAVETDVDGFDRVHVDVRWSAVASFNERERVAQFSDRPRPRRHVVTMVRSSSARPNQGGGMSNERCGVCLAPLSDNDRPTCEFCGHDLTSAAQEWQLASLAPFESWQRPLRHQPSEERALPAVALASERVRLLQLMAAVAVADGHVDASERRLLKQLSRRWNVPWEEIEVLLGMTDGAALFDAVAPQGPDQAEAFLRELVAMAKIDGRIDRRERRLIEQAAVHLRADRELVERLLAA